MSSKGKSSLSAFAVFKGKKDARQEDDTGTPVAARKVKGMSAIKDTTPTSSSSSINKSCSSKKKQKMDMKQIKKLFKSGGKKRPSYLPDTALNSPILANGKQAAGNNVELRSLRPKGSMTNIRYNLPLRATPEIKKSSKPPTGRSPSTVANGMESCTPPLPPRISRNKSDGGVRTSTNISDLCPVARPEGRSRRSYSPVSKLSPTPSLPPRLGGRPNLPSLSEGDLGPDRPAKRRKLSQGSGPPSPSATEWSSLLSLDGALHRTEPLPIHPAAKTSNQPYMFDSSEEAKRMFECLIHPVLPAKFFNELWEKKPLWVKRHNPEYNEGWFSTEELDKMLRQNQLNYGENIDVVAYINGKRETYNPPGRAHAPVVWDYYQNGCSVRVLNPQTYSKNVWKLLSILQEHFGCCAGVNVYLTPPGTQGFAPHWDDIDAFIIQLEGKKHWRLYSPRCEEETLPRYSSGNFSDQDIGTPLLDAVVEAGDLLYFPRGTIHQGKTLEDSHSMHITVSVCQQNTWGDLLEKLVPRALQIAIEEDVEFRKSLPRDYLNVMGVAFSDQDCPERKTFLRHVEQLMMKMLSYAPVDAACDQMGKKYIHDSLPPVLTEAEKQCSIHGHGKRWHQKQNRTIGAVEVELDTQVKIIRKGAIRMVTEDDRVNIYHNLENHRVYHGQDIQYIEIPAEMAPSVEYLLHSYPNYVSVDSFPCETIEEKIEIASIMYDKGMLVTDMPLKPLSDSESENGQ